MLHYSYIMIQIKRCTYKNKITAQVTARCMYDLESEWPAHNQGKTLG